jgi:long-chain acyl-CoA synthetase
MKLRQDNLISYLTKHESNVLLINELGEFCSYAEILDLGTGKPYIETCRKLVFCLTDNDIGGLGGYLALVVSGAVPLMLGASTSPLQLQGLINSYKPRYIWLPESRKEEIAGAVCLDFFAGYCLLDINGPEIEINESLSLLMGTSGSTGSPKFVRLSHKNVLSNAQSIADYLELDSTDLPITTLPPSYTYGLSIIHSHILVGATIAVTKKTFFDRSFWNFLSEVEATSFGGVPYHYEMLKKLRFTKMDLPSLKTLTQAGGRMNPELAEEFANYCENSGRRFFIMYGQTEATARMSYLPSKRATSKSASIGIAIPRGKFRLESERGQVISDPDIVGELVYIGPNVSMGYAYGHDDLAKGDERQGVLRTGDLAKRDKDGDYYIEGRLKRFIKLFGNRVNLLDVERLLFDAGYVVACVGQDDRLEIYLPAPSESQALQIKKLVIDTLKVALPGVAVYGIQELPYNESGKIQYSELHSQMGTLLT